MKTTLSDLRVLGGKRALIRFYVAQAFRPGLAGPSQTHWPLRGLDAPEGAKNGGCDGAVDPGVNAWATEKKVIDARNDARAPLGAALNAQMHRTPAVRHQRDVTARTHGQPRVPQF